MMYVLLTHMMEIWMVLFVFVICPNTMEGMKTIESQVGSQAVISWNIQNRTEDMLYINHNNKTITRLWPEKNYYKPTQEYNHRLNFSFVKQDLALTLNVLLKNISKLDDGLYTCYKMHRNEEISTVKLHVTGTFDEPRIKDISSRQSDSFEMIIVLFCQLSEDSNKPVLWWKNASRIVTDQKYIAFNNTLTIVNVKEADKYDNIFCGDDVDIIRSKPYRIRIDGPDSITFSQYETTLYEFSSLNITCLAQCNPSCTYQWIKHVEQDIPERLVSYLATMQITNASRKDEGIYACVAKNTVTNKTVAESIILDVTYHNDSRNNSPNHSRLPDERLHPLDTIETPVLTTILPGVGVICTCLICGLFVYKSQKRCCKQTRSISTAAEVVQADGDLGNTMVLSLVHSDIEPHTSYWTIGDDSTGVLRTMIDQTGVSISPCLLSISCPVERDDPSENLEKICLPSDEDAYIHPI